MPLQKKAPSEKVEKIGRDIVHYRGGDGGGESADYDIGVHVVKLTKGKEDGGSSLLREAEGGSRL